MKHRPLITLLILLLIGGAIAAAVVLPTQLGLDLVGGVRGVFLATSQTNTPGAPEKAASASEMDTAISVIEKRVNKLGVSEAQVQKKGKDQIIVEIPLTQSARAHHMTATSAMKALNNVVQPAFLQFVEFPDTITVQPERKNAQGEETFIYVGPNGPLTEAQALAQAKVILSGKDLLPDAAAEFDPAEGYAVSLHFDDRGAAIFDDYTRTHIGKYFGVTLDQRLVTYPVIKGEIPGGHGQISGGFSTFDDANRLATLLNAGALPVKLKPLQLSLIEATLGASAIRTSVWAGVAGLILVILFMWAYYRLPGFLASVALVIYALYVFAIFKMIPVTLTLPGIAGFILSVGMAVDANILIFERMKEELRDGRTLRSAIDAGFSRALTAIVDSNACTLIACGVLGFYGTGPVKGFAVTLAIGVLVSLFTAITVTRTLLHLLDNAPQLQKPEYFGTDVQWMGKWAQGRDIIGRRRLYYSISLGVIVPGLLFLLGGQLRRGVDFTGGNEWIVQARQIQDSEVTAALRSAGLARDQFTMQTGTSLATGDRLATIHTKPGVMTPAIQAKALDDLQRQQGVRDATTASNEHIDPIIGKELEWNALSAVVIASLLIVLYLSVRFAHDGFKNGIKYGVCAIAAMLHDVLVVLGLFAIFGFVLQVEIDMNFVTAILTIIGFSVHDTIVIFDRVRENLQRRKKGESFEEIYNRSIVQTAARSINTSFTVILVLTALVVFGDPVIRWFNVALLVGIISGTYSSIFNASPLVVDWQLFKRRREALAGGVGSARRSASSSSSSSAIGRNEPPTSPRTNGERPLRPATNGGRQRNARPGGTLQGSSWSGSRPAGSTPRSPAPDTAGGRGAAVAAAPGASVSLPEESKDVAGTAQPAPGSAGGVEPVSSAPGRVRVSTVRPARPAAGKVAPRRKQRH